MRPGRDRLAGMVEIDETYIGGEESGLPGGRARGKKVLTGIAVEIREPRGFGRCRMLPLADASAASLHPFVSHVFTDSLSASSSIEETERLQEIHFVVDFLRPRSHAKREEVETVVVEHVLKRTGLLLQQEKQLLQTGDAPN